MYIDEITANKIPLIYLLPYLDSSPRMSNQSHVPITNEARIHLKCSCTRMG